MRSSWTKPLVLLTLAAVVLLTSAAFAETVVITPDNMAANGWATATYYGGSVEFKDASVRTAIPYTSPVKYASPAGGPLPYGAFYGATGMEGSDPPKSPDAGQVWIGTNQLTGKYIREITKMEYDTWTLSCGNDAVHHVWQPFQIQIAIRKTGPTDPNWRYLMFRPWGSPDYPAGYNQLNPYNSWVGNHHNAMAGVWFEPWTHKTYVDWEAVKAAFQNGYIDTPAQSPLLFVSGSLPGTGTGYSFNLVAGAHDRTSPFLEAGAQSWWQESFNFMGYVDNLTIGVNGVETTYDFEPTDRPDPSTLRKVMVNNAAAKARVNRTAKFNTRYVLVGYVQAPIDENPNDYQVGVKFKIADYNTAYNPGSFPGNEVLVICPDHTLMPGQLVRVEGMLEEITTPAMLMTTIDKITEITPY